MPIAMHIEAVICTASLVAVWLLLNWVTRGSYPYLMIGLAAMLVALAGVLLFFTSVYFGHQVLFGYQVLFVPPLCALAAYSSALALFRHEAGVIWPAAALIVALGVIALFMAIWNAMICNF